jgi:hypothetical protein
VFEYEEAILEEKIDWESVIGERCPLCGRTGCWREIAPYMRTAIELFPFREGKITIARFQCRERRRTFSLLPTQLAPYHLYTVESMILAVLLWSEIQAEQGGGASAAANLEWRTAHKTWYESYPDPNSEECIEYNGCFWEGQFAACEGKKEESWVAAHHIVSAFPDFEELELHDLCLRKGSNTIVVTVIDTCSDLDCDNCCTENLGDAEQLIDMESYTNDAWGIPDGEIEWADLGPTKGDGCE